MDERQRKPVEKFFGGIYHSVGHVEEGSRMGKENRGCRREIPKRVIASHIAADGALNVRVAELAERELRLVRRKISFSIALDCAEKRRSEGRRQMLALLNFFECLELGRSWKG